MHSDKPVGWEVKTGLETVAIGGGSKATIGVGIDEKNSAVELGFEKLAGDAAFPAGPGASCRTDAAAEDAAAKKKQSS